jgi:hypothetical protein
MDATRKGLPLHILDLLLKGLAISRVSMKHFNIITLLLSPLCKYILVYVHLFIFFWKINHSRAQLHSLILCPCQT